MCVKVDGRGSTRAQITSRIKYITYICDVKYDFEFTWMFSTCEIAEENKCYNKYEHPTRNLVHCIYDRFLFYENITILK